MDRTENGCAGNGHGLNRYLSPLSVWAPAFGCAVGWGAFVMPGTTFLPIAGPLGTVLGLSIGAAVMLVIGANYHYMMARCPETGGTFSFVTSAFGYDHGLLSAWFLMLVYIAIVWANATALPIIFRNLLGSTFQVGFHYQIAGYDVYLGEVLLSLTALWICGAVCIRSGRLAAAVQLVMAFILLGGILIGFGAVCIRNGEGSVMEPLFAKSSGQMSQVLRIVALSPWAFVGFESVSHSTEEFRFDPKRTFVILSVAVIAGGIAYIFLALLAISVLPNGYGSWFAYINDLGSLSGLEGLPTFYAVHERLGRGGLVMMGVTVVAAVITGLVGNYTAASRLIWSMARDEMLPGQFRRLSREGTPSTAIFFIMLISLPVPFLGRTAIGWIVDVNTIGALIAYAYTSAVAFKTARDEGNVPIQMTGLLGAAISLLFFLYFLVPSFWSVSALATESYLILIAWSILGFIFFRYIFMRDTRRRFGRSTIVWIVLLFLIFFVSMLWVREATHDTTERVLIDLNYYNMAELKEHGIELTDTERADAAYYLHKQMSLVSESLKWHGLAQMVLILAALFIMFNIYDSMMQREKDLELKRQEAEQSNRAKSTFLSNMSHDIRTPMNAIIGYTGLAKKEEGLSPKAEEYLDKIEASSQHLLSLINDVLEMSRIESGKIELDIVSSDIVKAMDEVRDLFVTQMEAKRIAFTVTTEGVTDRMVMCDTDRLDRVLLNLISNAFKFTPEGGAVSVSLTQTGSADGVASYEIRVRDTGIGMSPGFAVRVFEAYERERTVSKIQGTGLGMAITKSIIDLMGGDISVKTEQGKGSEFVIHVSFPLAECVPEETGKVKAGSAGALDFTDTRLLLVDDNEINREIATLLLEEVGFELETAENGKEAVEKVASSAPGHYQAILMDVQMPVMNGYEATKAIRGLDDPALSGIPIIAMTANAFTEDVQAAKEAGMDGHIAKPIDVGRMIETLTEILRANE